MKMRLLTIVVLLASLFLASCGTASGDNMAKAAVELDAMEAPQEDVTLDEDQLNKNTDTSTSIDVAEAPQAIQLALGTFKLDQTDFEVDANQAAELLPLWKAARSLSESETTATAEVEAILKQIQDTMTSEQLQAIEVMDLTMQDMDTIADELDLNFGGAGGGFGNMDPETRATMQAARESGQGPPEGMGFPGGGGGPGIEGELNPEVRETAMAERDSTRGATLGLNPMLLDAIIAFLEAK